MKVLLALLLLVSQTMQKPEGKGCVVQVLVGPAKNVRIVVPCVSKEQLGSMSASFLGRGKDKPEGEIDDLLKKSDSVTLVLTSKELDVAQ